MQAVFASGITEICDKFGVNIPLLAGNCITFFAVAAVLYYFVFKPVMAKSAERISIIEKGLSDAEKAKEALANSQKDAKEELAKAAQSAAKIVADAKESANKAAEKIAQDAAQKAAALIAESEKRAEFERAKIRSELMSELGTLVSQAAARAVADVLSEQQKAQIAEKAASYIEKE